MFSYSAACDLDEELVELVTMLIVTCDGDCSCALRPYDRARCVLVYLRKHDAFDATAHRPGLGNVGKHPATAQNCTLHTERGLAPRSTQRRCTASPSNVEQCPQPPAHQRCDRQARHSSENDPRAGQPAVRRFTTAHLPDSADP